MSNIIDSSKTKENNLDFGAENYRRFLDGDEEGLSEIVKEYSDGLLLFINKVVCDYCTAEDIVEDIFAELIVKRRTFNNKSKFKTYLYKIGRNKALNHIKKSSIAKLISQDKIEETADIDSSAEKRLIDKERDRVLYKALRELKTEYRQVLYLIYFQDMSYANISSIMKKSVKQIKNIAYRSKRALKRILEKEEGFDYYEDI